MKDLVNNCSLLFLFTLLSCQSTLDMEEALDGYESRLVIDGSIEEGGYAQVALTNSVAYLEDVNRDDLLTVSELGAKVILSNGVQSEVLVLRRNSRSNFPPFVYESDQIVGEVGKNYTLTIEFEGEEYVSTTTIPPSVSLDTVWYEIREDRYFIYGRLSDSTEDENYYRVFTSVNGGRQYTPTYLSTLSDEHFDGKTFDFSIYRRFRGFDGTEGHGAFYPGENVTVKFSSLDREHYLFWTTVESEIYSFSNPFSSSGNDVEFNVDPKAIGVWGGYSSTYYSLKME